MNKTQINEDRREAMRARQAQEKAMAQLMLRYGYYLYTREMKAFYDNSTKRMTYIEWLAPTLGWRVMDATTDLMGYARAYSENRQREQSKTRPSISPAVIKAETELEFRVLRQHTKEKHEAAMDKLAELHKRKLEAAKAAYLAAGDEIVGYNLRTCPITAKEEAYISYLTCLYSPTYRQIKLKS